MVNIAWEAPNWSGNTVTNQYIQDAIDGQGAGTTYNIQAGIHRGQSFKPKAGDVIIIEATNGAELSGAQDISGGWTDNGNGTWSKSGITRGLFTRQNVPARFRPGYDPGELNCIVVDKKLKAWRTVALTSLSAAQRAESATYSGSTVTIGTDPTGLTVEICRTTAGAIGGQVNDVTVRSDDPSVQAEIYGYASDTGYTYAPVRGGYPFPALGSDPTGTGWVMQDLWIHSNTASGFAGLHTGTYERLKVTGNGQIGCGGSSGTFRYSYVADNGITGWSHGFAAGNSKWIGTDTRDIIQDCAWGYSADLSANQDVENPIWWDVPTQNDGVKVQGNVFFDDTENGAIGVPVTQRGLFFEVGEAIEVHRNIFYKCGRSADSTSLRQGAMLMSNSGPAASGDAFNPALIWENHAYMCGGGFNGRMQLHKGDGHVRDYSVYKNIIYLDTALSFTPFIGVSWNGTGANPTGVTSENNFYYLASAATQHFYDEQVGGGGPSLNWTQWKNAGHDDGAGAFLNTERNHPSGDPDPFNGGCM